MTYLVGVEACCVSSSCLEQTSFEAFVDSGTSFTYLPDKVYKSVVSEVCLCIITFGSMFLF